MICVVFGTSAEYIKLWPFLKYSSELLEMQLLNSQQHKIEDELLINLQQSFEIKNLHGDLYQAKTDLKHFVAWSLKSVIRFYRYFGNFKRIHPDGMILVHGDTTTALIAGIVARVHRRKLVHVEAGYRSGNLANPFPEELNRIILDQISNLSFCPTDIEAKVIPSRNEAVVTKGNTGADGTSILIGDALPFQVSTRGIVTLHRSELVMNSKRLRTALKNISEFSLVNPLDMYVGALEKDAISFILKDFEHEIRITPKLNYVKFIKKVAAAPVVITDSGGLQQECNLLGIPCFIVRNNVEQQDLRDNCVLVGIKADGLSSRTLDFRSMRNAALIPLTDSPSKTIANHLVQYIN